MVEPNLTTNVQQTTTYSNDEERVHMELIPLNISDLHKHFAKHAVLKGVNLQLQAGEIFGLIGLNGMGKTTIIKSILDLLQPDQGTITLFGLDHQQKISRRDICYLPEKFQPPATLKGKEFLSLYIANFSLSQAKNYAQALDLDPACLEQKISKYSKGMTQKLGIIYTFMHPAKLIILDEPMSGLDPKARILFKKELLNSHQQGKTIFFSSHILTDIQELCDRMAVLNDGRISFIGTPTDFCHKHKLDNNIEKAFLQEIGMN